MIEFVINFLKKLFGKEEPPPEPEAPQKFTIPHPWPFKSGPPKDEDPLIREMIRGVQTIRGHAFYVYRGQTRRHLRNEKGRETHMARHIVWWMEGRKFPDTARGLTTTCGEPKCIKLDHLALVPKGPELGPQRSKEIPKANHVAKRKQPPAPSAPKNKTQQEKPHLEKGDRSKCPTSKVYFKTQGEARRRATILNAPEIRGKGRRVYPYDTPCPYCFGWHLTKIKPGTYKRNPIKNSSY